MSMEKKRKFPILASKGNVQEIILYRAEFPGFSGKHTEHTACKFYEVGHFTFVPVCMHVH